MDKESESSEAGDIPSASGFNAQEMSSRIQDALAQIRLSSEDADGLYAFGHQLYGQGRYADAALVFVYLVMYAAPEHRHYMGLAACQQAERKFEAALELYQACFLLAPEDPNAYLHTGECLLRLGRKEEALEALDRVITLCDGSARFDSLRNRASGIIELVRSGTRRQ